MRLLDLFAIVVGWGLVVFTLYVLYSQEVTSEISIQRSKSVPQLDTPIFSETLPETIPMKPSQPMTDHSDTNRSYVIRIRTQPGQRVWMQPSWLTRVPNCTIECYFDPGTEKPTEQNLREADGLMWSGGGGPYVNPLGAIAKEQPQAVRVIFHSESETLHTYQQDSYSLLGNFYDISITYHLPEDAVLQDRRSKGYNFTHLFASYALLPIERYFEKPRPFREKVGNLDLNVPMGIATSFITNCKKATSGRKNFILQLEKSGIRVDSFGPCHSAHKRSIHEFPECAKIVDRYDQKMCLQGHFKFALALENSFDESYVTEKVFHALASGSVPIYYGAGNIDKFLPTYGTNLKSVIKASDFNSTEDLANFILKISQDENEYNKYLLWKEMPPTLSFRRIVDADMYKFNLHCDLCKEISRLKNLGKDYLEEKRKLGSG